MSARPTPLLCLLASLSLAPGLLAQDASADPDSVWASFDPDGAYDHARKSEDAGAPPPIDSGDGWAGGPFSDECTNATIIPGNTVQYSPGLLNTVGTSNEVCEPLTSSCAGLGTTNSVWYSYTPDQDGSVTIDTLGSNYDTVLSVFDGCPVMVGIFCLTPNELACNNDYFFGTTSQLFFEVDAGTTYKIRVADDSSSVGGGLLDFDLRFAPGNDVCANATPIHAEAYDPPLLSTHNADLDPCEADETCEFNGVGTSNSVWYRYVPPCDGSVSVNTNGSDYDTVLSIHDGCAIFNGIDNPCTLPTQLACDDDGGTGTASQLFDVPVVGGQEILIKVADYNLAQGGGWLDFNLVFTAANPPLADIATPSGFDCVCGNIPVLGSATTGGEDGLVEWSLDSRPVNGGAWSLIASSNLPVTAGNLANWNVSGLGQGYYLLRLTVTNSCGATDTDSEVVFIDKTVDSVDLQSPQDGQLLGGTACVEGTAQDTCFSQYALDVAPAGSGAWAPIGASPHASTVINSSLAPGGWDTTSVPDGVFDLRLTVVDDCGQSQGEEVRVIVDNTKPVAQIDGPRQCLVSTDTVVFRGTAFDENLSHWQLQVTGGSFEGWTVIGQGSEPVFDSELGSLELGELPKCAYTVRLLVWDATLVDCHTSRFSEDLVSISNAAAVIAGQQP